MENKQTLKYQDYIGKSRSYMMSAIDNEHNHYLSDLWFYHIRTNWLGKKIFLLIWFEKDCVCKIEVKKIYEKKEDYISTKNKLLDGSASLFELIKPDFKFNYL